MGLKRFEERLERLVEGSFARPFRSSLQPVEIGRRLTREMDLARRVGPRGQLVCPNSFRITLSPDDIDRFESYIDALAKELKDNNADNWVLLFKTKDVQHWEFGTARAVGLPVLLPWVMTDYSEQQTKFERNA